MQRNRSERRATQRAETKRLKKEEKKMAKNGTNANKFNSKKCTKASSLVPLVCKESKESVALTKTVPSLKTAYTCTVEYIQLTPDYSDIQDDPSHLQVIENVSNISTKGENSERVTHIKKLDERLDKTERLKKEEFPKDNKTKDTHTTIDTKQGHFDTLDSFALSMHDEILCFQDNSPLSNKVAILPVAETQGLSGTNKTINHDDTIHKTVGDYANEGHSIKIDTLFAADSLSQETPPLCTNSLMILSTDPIFQTVFEPENGDVMINFATISTIGSSEEKIQYEAKHTYGETTQDITERALFLCESSSTSIESVIDQFIIQPKKPFIYPTPSTSLSGDSSNLSDKKKSNVFSRVFRKGPKKAGYRFYQNRQFNNM